MTSHNVAQLLPTLGVAKSHSRPHVSNDNPFPESQFKTLKFRPDIPDRFESHEEALRFCRTFFTWHNDAHYHSGIGLLTDELPKIGAERRLRAERLTYAYAGRDFRLTDVHGRVLHVSA